MEDYARHRTEIERELKDRISKHRSRIQNRRRMRLLAISAGAQPLNLLAQGDSWFDFPLPVFIGSDVLVHLRSLPNGPAILSLAHRGEAAEDLLGVHKLNRFVKALENQAQNGVFDAILFSGGGNDLVGDQFRIWLRNARDVQEDPDHGLNEERVEAALQLIRAAYEDLIIARNKVASEQGTRIPIFAHSYDFAIPSNVGVCNVEPWLWPGLNDRGWSAETGEKIVRNLLTRFSALLDIISNNDPEFIHVKTQGSLMRTDWSDELHPTPEGFAKIAVEFSRALAERFPGRI